MSSLSPRRRADVIDALRRGTVPQQGLDVLAVGLDRFESHFDEGFRRVRWGGQGFKAVQGEYGSGKTFASRWIQERAKRNGFVTAEVQISETETPLHRLETVYRRIIERLSNNSHPNGALRPIIACHCRQCRKTSGHYVAATACANKNLEINGDGLRWYRSSDVAERGFCGICGSNLFWRRLGSDQTSIWAGGIDGPTGLKIESQWHTESKGDYYELPDAPIGGSA